MAFKKINAFGVLKEKFKSDDTVLIVIDVQNYSINQRWKLIENVLYDSPIRTQLYPDYYKRLNEKVIPNIIDLINISRGKLKKILFVKYENLLSNFEDLNELHKAIWNNIKNKTGMSFEPGEDNSFEIINEIKNFITSKDIVIKKSTNGLFASTNIDAILRNLGIKNLIICGAWTNCCVETSVREAFDKGYHVFLSEDACIAPGKIFHKATLLNLGNFYCNICNTKSLISEIIEL